MAANLQACETFKTKSTTKTHIHTNTLTHTMALWRGHANKAKRQIDVDDGWRHITGKGSKDTEEGVKQEKRRERWGKRKVWGTKKRGKRGETGTRAPWPINKLVQLLLPNAAQQYFAPLPFTRLASNSNCLLPQALQRACWYFACHALLLLSALFSSRCSPTDVVAVVADRNGAATETTTTSTANWFYENEMAKMRSI